MHALCSCSEDMLKLYSWLAMKRKEAQHATNVPPGTDASSALENVSRAREVVEVLDSPEPAAVTSSHEETSGPYLHDSAPPALPSSQCVLADAELLLENRTIVRADALQRGALLHSAVPEAVTVHHVQEFQPRDRDFTLVSLTYNDPTQHVDSETTAQIILTLDHMVAARRSGQQAWIPTSAGELASDVAP